MRNRECEVEVVILSTTKPSVHNQGTQVRLVVTLFTTLAAGCSGTEKGYSVEETFCKVEATILL